MIYFCQMFCEVYRAGAVLVVVPLQLPIFVETDRTPVCGAARLRVQLEWKTRGPNEVKLRNWDSTIDFEYIRLLHHTEVFYAAHHSLFLIVSKSISRPLRVVSKSSYSSVDGMTAHVFGTRRRYLWFARNWSSSGPFACTKCLCVSSPGRAIPAKTLGCLKCVLAAPPGPSRSWIPC